MQTYKKLIKLNHLSLMLSDFDNYVHRSDLVIDFFLEVHSLMALRKYDLLQEKQTYKKPILYLLCDTISITDKKLYHFLNCYIFRVLFLLSETHLLN